MSRSFSSASRSSGYSWPSTGYSPAKTIGFISLKPGNAAAVGRAVSVIVSPICASLTVLMFAMTKPTSPTPSSSTTVGLGEKTPTCSISKSCPFAISRTFSFGRMTPSMTRMSTITPR